ncbi:MAG: hypothetical protein FWF03_07955 [Defluviitaleaceae bacterium]|nr:hypothetical protein [Defluviitaleaceae bacterium]
MKSKKTIIAFILAGALVLSLVSGCGGGGLQTAGPTAAPTPTPTETPEPTKAAEPDPTIEPTPEPEPESVITLTNLLANSNWDFEEGSDGDAVGWFRNDGGEAGVTMFRDEAQAYRGEASVYTNDKVEGFEGPAFDITEILNENGPGRYYIEYWILPDTNVQVLSSFQVDLNAGGLLANYQSDQIAVNNSVGMKMLTAFKCVSAIFDLDWAGAVDGASLKISCESDAFWVDAVRIFRAEALTEIFLPNGDFESGELLPEWYPNQEPPEFEFYISEVNSKNGKYSGYVTEKTVNWQCLCYDALDIFKEYGKGFYFVEAWFLSEVPNSWAGICIGTNSATGWRFPTAGGTSLGNEFWKKIEATIDVTWDGTLVGEAPIYPQAGGDVDYSFWVDDLRLFKVPDYEE